MLHAPHLTCLPCRPWPSKGPPGSGSHPPPPARTHTSWCHVPRMPTPPKQVWAGLYERGKRERGRAAYWYVLVGRRTRAAAPVHAPGAHVLYYELMFCTVACLGHVSEPFFTHMQPARRRPPLCPGQSRGHRPSFGCKAAVRQAGRLRARRALAAQAVAQAPETPPRPLSHLPALPGSHAPPTHDPAYRSARLCSASADIQPLLVLSLCVCLASACAQPLCMLSAALAPSLRLNSGHRLVHAHHAAAVMRPSMQQAAQALRPWPLRPQEGQQAHRRACMCVYAHMCGVRALACPRQPAWTIARLPLTRVCVHANVRVCVFVCVRACVCACACICVRMMRV